jgi:steroid 5-alpha reductase family enzyme
MGVILTSILVLAFVIMEAVADRQQYTFQTENYRLKKHDEILTDEYADGFKQSGLFAIVRKPNYDCRASNVEELFRLPFLLVSWNWSVIGIIQLVLLFQQVDAYPTKIDIKV